MVLGVHVSTGFVGGSVTLHSRMGLPMPSRPLITLETAPPEPGASPEREIRQGAVLVSFHWPAGKPWQASLPAVALGSGRTEPSQAPQVEVSSLGMQRVTPSLQMP